MTRKSCLFTVTLVVASSVLVSFVRAQPTDRFAQYWGSPYTPAPLVIAAAARAQLDLAVAAVVDRVHHWNLIAVDTSGLDHTPVGPGETRVFGEQLGPGRSARAMAVVHIAIADAVNSIARRYRSFTGIPDASLDASMDAAIAQAAHDTLVAMFPSQKPHCDELLAEELATIPDGPSKQEGIRTGERAAAAILARVANDGSNHPEPALGSGYVPGDKPGEWRQDPISQLPVALGAHWGEVTPLVLRSSKQFRVPPPPDVTSWAYAEAYNEVKRLGGDGTTTETERTDDQTIAGIYWAYDGTPSLCAPPRLYNQIAVQIADQMGTDTVDLARLLAVVNLAMSDAGIASWESKYHYAYWRPVAGIRESDRGTGPSGKGDRNSETIGDPTFSPLGAPASNLQGPNFTPPFPAYPSGHAVFGGAVFQTLRNVYGTDHIAFTFVSDELNGETLDNRGNVRPLAPRSFASLSQAEEENGQSRIYLGIHWSFDKTAGIQQGREVANYVFQNAFQPR
jgi:PAP2 superfamily